MLNTVDMEMFAWCNVLFDFILQIMNEFFIIYSNFLFLFENWLFEFICTKILKEKLSKKHKNIIFFSGIKVFGIDLFCRK